jgi:hypothetical protein
MVEFTRMDISFKWCLFLETLNLSYGHLAPGGSQSVALSWSRGRVKIHSLNLEDTHNAMLYRAFNVKVLDVMDVLQVE